MAASSPEPNLGTRPLSPHLQVWRWHITMLTSILTRLTGVGITLGVFGAVIWLAALAGGPSKFVTMEEIVRSPVGQVLMFLMAIAAAFHFAAGVRHLVWDAGRGLHPKTANVTAWVALVFAVLAPVGLWAIAGAFGSVAP